MLFMAATGDPDAELMRGLCQGDRERAMTELYDRYARRIHGLGVRLLSDRALAEELVQETFVRLWRSSGRFDPARGSAGSEARPGLTSWWRNWPCGRPCPSSPTTTARCSSWPTSKT
ncbi:MAG: sigma factor [Thermoleophilaceae bacterium]